MILVLVQVLSLVLVLVFVFVFVIVQIWIESNQIRSRQIKSNQILRLNLEKEGKARVVCDLLRRRFAHNLRREAI